MRVEREVATERGRGGDADVLCISSNGTRRPALYSSGRKKIQKKSFVQNSRANEFRNICELVCPRSRLARARRVAAEPLARQKNTHRCIFAKMNSTIEK